MATAIRIAPLSFNRTIMELKDDWLADNEIAVFSFNRTIMELKVCYEQHKHGNAKVLIEP